MRGIRHEAVTVEPFPEHRFTCSDGLVGVHLVETGRTPRFLVALYNERRGLVVELVAVRLEHAVFVLDKEESERVERSRCAEPCETSRSCVEIGLKIFCVLLSDRAVDAVGGDDHIGVAEPEGIETRVVVDIDAETKIDSQFPASVLKDLKQLLSCDATEAMSAGSDSPVADEYIDVVPVCKVGGDRAISRLVGRAKVLHCLIGEHDAPAEGVIRTVPLEHGDLVRRVGFLEEDCRVEPGRTAANDDDFQWFPLIERRVRDIIGLKQVPEGLYGFDCPSRSEMVRACEDGEFGEDDIIQCRVVSFDKLLSLERPKRHREPREMIKG